MLVGAYRVITVISVIIVVTYVAWLLLVPKPGMAEELEPAQPNRAEDTADPAPDASPDARKDDCWTFLLIGTDRVGAQTVSVASIPRDTKVDADRRVKKINSAYAYGGMDGLKQEIYQTFGLPVDYYIKVDVQAFVALVDEVDGIDFYVPCDMDYDDPWQDLSIHYKEGMQHLSGQQALEVCRFRHNNDMTGYSDTGRMETQRGVLTAVAQKVISWGSLARINGYLEIIAEYVETDLSLTDMMWFASQAIYFDMDGLNTMTMPAEWHSPYMYLDPEETLEMVNTYLNPYEEPRTAEQLNIPTLS